MPTPDPMTLSVSDADPNAASGVDPSSPSTPHPPVSTQRYLLADEIARGGMGVIYRATDTTLGREVAVKVLHEKHGPDAAVARRFADEARIAGQLQHPAIPPVHDLGTLSDGRPFLAMKLIKGATLDRLLEARPDVSAERGRFVAVFEQVCQALAYAHSHNVIHRDLKPANVMVGAFGEVQVMDWGLAKVLASRDREGADADPEETTSTTRVGSQRESDGALTQAGSVLGTPAFMPPEQALGAVGKVDARSDVFGLGAILAVILTGQPPFTAESAETTRMQAAQGNVAECLARLDVCGAEPDLVALCKRCLSPMPADRPADAGAVATAVADLRAAADARARRAELESAAAQTRELETRKRQRLTRALAAVSMAAAVALLAGAGTAAWFAIRAHDNAQRADDNAKRADEKAQEADNAAQRVTERAYLSDMRVVQQFWDGNLFYPYTAFLERQRPEHTGGRDLRGFEWFFWNRRARWATTLSGHTWVVNSVAYSPDGKRIVSGSGDWTVKVWDAETGKGIRSLPGHANLVSSVAVSADGKRIASGSYDGTVKIWDAETGQEIRSLKGHAAEVGGVAFSADGKRLASGSFDRTVKVWDVETGKVIRPLEGHRARVSSVAFSADGKRLASAGGFEIVGGSAYEQDPGELKLWNVETGQEVRSLAGHTAAVSSVAFRADGKRLVSGSFDRTVKVWDAETGQELRSLQAHTEPVVSVAFSADGTRIASGSGDRRVKVWDAETGQELYSLQGHEATVTSVAFRADGKRLVSGSHDHTVKVWPVEGDPSVSVLAGHSSQVTAVAVSPDGKSLASAGGVWDAKLSRYSAGELKLWDATGRPRDLLTQSTGVTSVAFSPDGALLASGSGTWDAGAKRYTSGEVRLWSAKGEAITTLTAHKSSVLSLVFSPDGSQLASCAIDGSLVVWDVARRQKAFDLPGQKKAVTALAFSPDGAQLAAAGFDMVVTVFDLPKRQPARTLTPNIQISGLAFSPDGSRLAVTGYALHETPVFDVATGKLIYKLAGHTGFATSVAFSPDGKRIATSGEDRTVRLWDAASGLEVLTLKGHTDIVRSVAFSKDGHRLVSGGWDKTVRIWDATPLKD